MTCCVAAANSSPSAAVSALPNGVQAIVILEKGSGAVLEDEKGSSLVVSATRVRMAGVAQGAEPHKDDVAKLSVHHKRR